MPGLSMEVGNHPVLFSELNGADRKSEEFTAPQSTTNEKSKDGVVAFAPETIALRVQQQRAVLIGSEPVAQSHADSAYAFDSADAGGKFWTEQAGISCLVRHTPDRGQAEVDRCWSEVPLFQMDSVSKNNRAVKSKSWFRTVPVDELVYRMIVRSLAAFRSQAVQYSRLRLFEIG
jgi:Tfp pilus assembly protein PilV